jgi:hypothetical protein
MIEYAAIAESSAVILTIYFLLFGVTIILAVIEDFYSFIFLIISLVFLPFSINYLLKFFESSLNITESLKGKL